MPVATDLNTPFSKAELKSVKAVRFTTFDSETLVRYSVAEVKEIDIYRDGKPITGGLNDPRLGPIDPRTPCETCGERAKECPGHWGHLTLARPMFNYGFLKATHNVLRCVCYHCFRLLADPRDHKMMEAVKLIDKKKRLQAVMLCCRSKKKCQAIAAEEEIDPDDPGKEFKGGCGRLQPRYFIEETNFYVAFPETEEDEASLVDKKRPLPADEVLKIFRGISDSSIKLMGFDPVLNPPKSLILTHLAIPPPHVRPTVSFGSNRTEDDVTMKLMDIVKVNKALDDQVKAGREEKSIEPFLKLLQYHVYTLMDNCIMGIPQAMTKSKRKLKSIRERLKSKEGRLRGTLMGKRVDFCARSVIGGDPNLDTEQVGVPRSIALTLTFPERVTPHNKQKLQQAVATGPIEHPGARYIVREDGTRVDLKFVKDRKALDLGYGWVVERHMVDGDYVVFNRQPSLHKMSMMGHRVKVMPFSTLRFNLAVTPPYNADFDGDEMNLHLAQSHETRSEIKHIMLNPRQVVSPQGNKPVMGIVQDSLLATSKYTKRDTFMEKDLAMNILMWLPEWDGTLPTPAILRPKELWTGKQILSMLLPPTLSMKRDSAIQSKNKTDDPDFSLSDCKVLIQNGEILSGIVCKKTIGASGGSLIHLVWLDYGPEKSRNVLSYLQKMVNQWMTHNGFTCGVADIIANDQTLKEVERTLMQAKEEVRKIQADAQRGRVETQPGKTMYQSFEARVNQRLNAAREDAGNIGSRSLDERNNIISMVNAGSKGSPINIAQIIACVGQQNVEGQRIRYGFNGRTLPHFVKDDYGAESRGFVENSYLGGLTPQEVWMHAMGGREGVIDTACKTSETGYIQRRLVKSMETLRVHYDGTSRNGANDVIQFVYGEDGMDGLLIEDQNLELMNYPHDKLDRVFKHNHEHESYGLAPKRWLPDDVLEKIKTDEESQRILDEEFEELKRLKKTLCTEVFPDGDTKQHIPINIHRLIGRARQRSADEEKDKKQERFTPMEIIEQVNRLMKQELQVTRDLQEGDTVAEAVEENAKIILNAHLRCALASRKILEQEKLSKESFTWLLGEIKARFNKSLAFPGEVVGTLAAQSVGEPATQMTLNTFHFAGVGAKNVTLGVPRLKELINVAKNVKTPSLAVFLSGDIGKHQERAKDVQSMLEHTTLKNVTSFTQIFWDPDPVNTRVIEDKEWVSEYYELPDEDDNPGRCGPWLLRIQLSNKVMTDKKLTVREVGRIIKDNYPDLDCIFTDDNAEELVLRIRLYKDPVEMDREQAEGHLPFDPNDDSSHKDYIFMRLIEQTLLKQLTLKGINGIKKVFMREDTVARYREDTGKFDRTKEWVLDTDGVNLEEVMLKEEVDFKRIQSNDIVEIAHVLGIEAVRKALLQQIRMVISFDGSYVNYRHLGTLCDVMTNRGHLMAITRHGINRTNMGPLMKCSFEETVEILMDAAIYNQTDYMRAVSENIIMGQLAPIGTGVFDVLIDDGFAATCKECFYAMKRLPNESKHCNKCQTGQTGNGPKGTLFSCSRGCNYHLCLKCKEKLEIVLDGAQQHMPHNIDDNWTTQPMIADVTPGTESKTPYIDEEGTIVQSAAPKSTGASEYEQFTKEDIIPEVTPGDPKLMRGQRTPYTPQAVASPGQYTSDALLGIGMLTTPASEPQSPSYSPDDGGVPASRDEFSATYSPSGFSGKRSDAWSQDTRSRQTTSPVKDEGDVKQRIPVSPEPVYSPTYEEEPAGRWGTAVGTSPVGSHTPGYHPYTSSPQYSPMDYSPDDMGTAAGQVVEDDDDVDMPPASPEYSLQTSPSYTPPADLGAEEPEEFVPSDGRLSDQPYSPT